MPLPERVRVKAMSDDAGYIDVTRVTHQEIAFDRLLDLVVAVAGLDASRIATILGAGTAVVGEHRYRWTPIAAEEAEIQPRLERFPKPEPGRPFHQDRCLFARIHAGVETIELSRESAAKRRLLSKRSFWEALMALSTARELRYETYSHRDQADIYSFEPTTDEEQALRRAAPLLRVDRTAEQITGLPLEKVTLYVRR
jgi:hypothetical protein